MPIPLFWVDAFTDRPFAGNPAAVCFLEQPVGDDWMQSVAAELNLSETAFLLPEHDAYRLRWFTPTVEVDLCGHATLASAHALWESGRHAWERPIRFQTQSGVLTTSYQAGWIAMDFPALPVTRCDPPQGLVEALGLHPRLTATNGMDYLVEAPDEPTLRALQPDLDQLRAIPTRGIIVTSGPESGPYDFVSRFFTPAAGVAEDPVTGSAHCALGPFWAERLGKTELLALQVSRRGGIVRVRLADDRVWLGGQAVTVLRGELP